MVGYQLTFFTQQDKQHGHTPLSKWLVAEGFGYHGKLHSAHFFELADQPVEVTMAVSAVDAERLFAALKAEQINIFYVRAPIEFGMTLERTGEA